MYPQVQIQPASHRVGRLPNQPPGQDRAEAVSKTCEQRVEMVREQSQQLMEQTRMQVGDEMGGRWEVKKM